MFAALPKTDVPKSMTQCQTYPTLIRNAIPTLDLDFGCGIWIKIGIHTPEVKAIPDIEAQA